MSGFPDPTKRKAFERDPERVGHPLQPGTPTFQPWTGHSRYGVRLLAGQILRTPHPHRSPNCGQRHSGWTTPRIPIGETCGVTFLGNNVAEKIPWSGEL